MKRAIALAGGGSKGSYQLGVWKALKELKTDYDIVTGNSIGAFNAALMVQGDYEAACELWNNISFEMEMDNNFKETEDLEYYSEHRDQILPFLKKYVTNKGADISPYLSILNKYIDEEKFFKSKIDYGIMTVKFPSMVPKEITKSQINRGYLKKWIQASTAVFPALPMCKVDDENYIDGLYYDNLPISTAFRLGAEEVIAVALRPGISKKKFGGNPLVKFIEPSESLGPMFAFDNKGIRKNITRGYNDAMRIVGDFAGIDYTFKNVDMVLCEKIAKRMLLKIMRLELRNEISRNKLINRITPTPFIDKIFKLNDKCNYDLFNSFLNSIETYMRLDGYDYYKVYDLKSVLKEAKGTLNPEIIKVIKLLKTDKFTIEKLQGYNNDVLISGLLVFSLISK